MPKRKLTVSVDGLRKGLAYNYNELVQLLHANTCDGGIITIHTDDIQGVMDKLRFSVAALHCVYMDDVDKFSDLSDDVDSIDSFNHESEEAEEGHDGAPYFRACGDQIQAFIDSKAHTK